MFHWVKENRDLVIMGGVFMLVCGFLFWGGGSVDALNAIVTTKSEDFSFRIGTGELEKSAEKSVLQISYEDELLIEQNKEDLVKMIDELEKNGSYDLPVETKKQKWSKKGINLIFDVTNSYREGVVDDADPQKRFKEGLDFLDKNAKSYLAATLKVGFLGAKASETRGGREINREIYTFNLKPYNQGQIIRITADTNSYLKNDEKRNVLHIEDVQMELLETQGEKNAECEQDSEYEFTCKGGSKGVLAKIEEIGKHYLSGEYSRGTYLLEFLNKNKEKLNIESDFVFFSDGEFQLTDDVLKKDLARLNADYRISTKGYVYNADNYSKDAWFPKYWESAIKFLASKTDFCREYENTITFVGLTQTDNFPFIDYSKSFFPKLFDGCEVEIK